MSKLNFTVTKDGKQYTDYNWDEKTKTFSTTFSTNDLVLDFSGINGVTFNTGYNCTFTTGPNCTFTTGPNCTFKTGSDCNFNTGNNCTFTTSYNCTFTTGEKCVVVRRDIYEIIELVEGETIKLNDCNIKGFTKINTKKIITIDKTSSQL